MRGARALCGQSHVRVCSHRRTHHSQGRTSLLRPLVRLVELGKLEKSRAAYVLEHHSLTLELLRARSLSGGRAAGPTANELRHAPERAEDAPLGQSPVRAARVAVAPIKPACLRERANAALLASRERCPPPLGGDALVYATRRTNSQGGSGWTLSRTATQRCTEAEPASAATSTLRATSCNHCSTVNKGSSNATTRHPAPRRARPRPESHGCAVQAIAARAAPAGHPRATARTAAGSMSAVCEVPVNRPGAATQGFPPERRSRDVQGSQHTSRSHRRRGAPSRAAEPEFRL